MNNPERCQQKRDWNSYPAVGTTLVEELTRTDSFKAWRARGSSHSCKSIGASGSKCVAKAVLSGAAVDSTVAEFS